MVAKGKDVDFCTSYTHFASTTLHAGKQPRTWIIRVTNQCGLCKVECRQTRLWQEPFSIVTCVMFKFFFRFKDHKSRSFKVCSFEEDLPKTGTCSKPIHILYSHAKLSTSSFPTRWWSQTNRLIKKETKPVWSSSTGLRRSREPSTGSQCKYSSYSLIPWMIAIAYYDATTRFLAG